MTSLLLDSNIIIYALQGRHDTLEILENIEDHQHYISTLTIFEVMNGSFLDETAKNEAQQFLECFTTLPITTDIAFLASRLFQQRRSTSLHCKPTIDILIEATTIYHQIPLLTANTRDFPEAQQQKLLYPLM